jgi:hypothetical protein
MEHGISGNENILFAFDEGEAVNSRILESEGRGNGRSGNSKHLNLNGTLKLINENKAESGKARTMKGDKMWMMKELPKLPYEVHVENAR